MEKEDFKKMHSQDNQDKKILEMNEDSEKNNSYKNYHKEITEISEDSLTPAMKQYMAIKEKYPDCIVMFRMGDFFEMFYKDAKTASKELDIVLTSRGKGEKKAPLAGIPFHSATTYIGKLITKGYKVCIVEQIEDPKKAKGIVKRDVVRIITPGTVIDETILNEKTNNYIMSINKEKDNIALAFSDVSTGEFCVLMTNTEKFETEINRYYPSEIIMPMSLENSDFAKSLKGFFINFIDDLHFYAEKAKKCINQHFGNITLKEEFLLTSAGALIYYIKETQKNDLKHINKIKEINSEEFMLIDKVTLQNLNIISNNKNEKATLLSVLDKTKTSIGSRLMKKIITKPLLNINEIKKRIEAVDEIKNDIIFMQEISELLESLQDIERLICRVNFKTATPKDIIGLKNTLSIIPKINKLLNERKSELINKQIPEFNELVSLISQAIKDEPNTLVREGNIIKEGYNKELDEIRAIKKDSKQWLLEFESKERAKTGIKSLKVKFNNVFGYFIEVSKSNLSLVPDNYIRKQTQVNCERYITNELKEKENIILSADDRINEIEYNLFMNILEEISKHTKKMQEASDMIAMIDVLLSFAQVSIINNYSKPVITENYSINIKSGRHPIVETIEQEFVSNDLYMDEKNRMHIITGPNMAGKSVYIKQNALIILMAQIGCFVPAESAEIGIVDRIFSRVGASDDISSGHSTFMVEMNETANILKSATEKSFIILDEIGRGTSTYDGVSLAWGIAEYIITKIKAKTLFATHYHHLNKMASEYDCIENYNVAVAEKEDGIIFLRKIVKGGTDKSYGIQVAKLAGIPDEVINTSKRIITQLEMEDEIGEMIHKNLKKQQKKNDKDNNFTNYLEKKKIEKEIIQKKLTEL